MNNTCFRYVDYSTHKHISIEGVVMVSGDGKSYQDAIYEAEGRYLPEHDAVSYHNFFC